MKHPSLRSSRSGFTLVELLVVIAIIALLASVAFPSIIGAVNQARRVKDSAIANQLQTAMINYQTEYSVYPNPNTATTDTYYGSTDSANWGTLTYALCGDIDPGHPAAAAAPSSGTDLNTRRIPFLNPSGGDLDRTKTPSPVKQTFTNKTTSAVQYFFMAVDTDYSGTLGDSSSAVTGEMPNFSSSSWTSSNFTSASVDLSGKTTQGVAVWCNNDQPTTGTKSNPNFWGHTY